MAIYEMTNSQYSKLKQFTSNNALPAVNTIEMWRGSPTGTSKYNWPSNGHESVYYAMKDIRTTLGGIMVDLPTHSEWEFACRAGSSTKYCNGDTEADLAKVAWYGGNATEVQEVGTKEPNAWGMYDMHGNFAEWTLDKCTTLSADPVWDPTGPMQDDATDGTKSAVCGGDYTSTADQCASGTGVGYQKAQVTRAARLTLPIQ
jgi:formylglycine-generating enzyme required for sulfatase activity